MVHPEDKIQEKKKGFSLFGISKKGECFRAEAGCIIIPSVITMPSETRVVMKSGLTYRFEECIGDMI